MAVPPPEAGLVVRYGYLWADDAKRGRRQGKDRPACLVAAIRRGRGRVEVLLLPITRSPPRSDGIAVEIPASVKLKLGLGREPSWIVANEGNIDAWPNPDLVPVPGQPGIFSYGVLPSGLFRHVRDSFMAEAKTARARIIKRDDDKT